MLRWRLFLGVPLIALLAGLFWFDAQAERPGIYLAPLAIALAILAAQELRMLFRAKGQDLPVWWFTIGTLLPVLASCAPIAWKAYPVDCPVGRLGWLACGLAAGLMVAIVGEMHRYEAPGRSLTNLAASALSVLYVGGLLGFFVQLRLLPERGMIALLSMVFAVKVSDIGQYTFGKLLGKTKLAPKLSPGKTWEGTVGGIATSILLTTAAFRWAAPEGTQALGAGVIGLVGYVLIICIAGIIGDLAESMLKRDAGVKDSSTWLPGFGGVLDLLDSLLVAAPAAYFCWIIGLVG